MKIVFDARWKNSSGVGQEIDPDIEAHLCVEGTSTPVEIRRLGDLPESSVIKTTDDAGYYYLTVVNGANYAEGNITIHWYAKRNGAPIQPYPLDETQYNYANDTLDVPSVKNYIFSMLGYPVVDVELTDAQIGSVFRNAMALYSQWVPMEKVITFNMIAGQSDYKFADMPPEGPTTVDFIRAQGLPYINDVMFGYFFPNSRIVSFDEYAMSLSYWSMLRRVMGIEPEWNWDESTATLWINAGTRNLATPYSQYVCMAKFFDTRTLGQVRHDHRQWFFDYSLALAKEILGRIRGKYSGIIPAPGGKVQMEYQLLLKESQESRAALTQQLRAMAPKMPPILG